MKFLKNFANQRKFDVSHKEAAIFTEKGRNLCYDKKMWIIAGSGGGDIGHTRENFEIAQIFTIGYKIVVATTISVFNSAKRSAMEKNFKIHKKFFTFLPFGAY